ncbi:MAG: hypothetical protein Q7N50_01700 [Armatimonadota bacterium]|nr:hypothetical protein [Armatimonadota bacterium]
MSEFLQTQDNRRLLLAGSLSLALHSAAAAILTEKAAFFPASHINQETFAQTLGAPTQLVQAVFAMCVALAIAAYSQAGLPAETKPCKRNSWLRLADGTCLILMLILIGGWVFTAIMGHQADKLCRLNLLRRTLNTSV